MDASWSGTNNKKADICLSNKDSKCLYTTHQNVKYFDDSNDKILKFNKLRMSCSNQIK